MEAIEHKSWSMASYILGQKLFPGDSGYKSETGGRLSNLRTLTVDTIRAYHRHYYRPDNMLVVVCGAVTPEQVFAALESTEARILSKPAAGPIPGGRPWTAPENQSDHCRPAASSTTTFEFPSDSDDSCGVVKIGWRGPAQWSDSREHAALHLLLTYLTDSSVSPLSREFVDTPDDPVCASVDFGSETNNSSTFSLAFDQTKVSLQAAIPARLMGVLASLEIDTERMRQIAHSERLRSLAESEDSPHEYFSEAIIDDFLYGARGSSDDLRASLRLAEDHFDSLGREPASFWRALLVKYLVENPYCAVIGVPSVKAAHALEEENRARVQARRDALGEQGLERLGEELAANKANNEIPVPASVLASFPVADPARVQLYSVSLRSDTSRATFHNVPTAFVSVGAFLDTSELTHAQRLYLELYTETMLELAVPGMTYEEVVAAVNRDTISTRCAVPSRDLCQFVFFNARAEEAKFAEAARWVKRGLDDQIYAADRIKVAAQKLLNRHDHVKHSGSDLVKLVTREAIFHKERSNHAVVNACQQIAFLKQVVARLDSEPAAVVSELAAVAKHLASRAIISVIGSERIRESVLDEVGLRTRVPADAPPVRPAHTLHAPGASLSQMIAARGIGSSAYLLQTIAGPSSPDDPAVIPLRIACEALCGLESYFWKQIRGAGLSYSYGLNVSTDDGLVSFTLSRSTNLAAAYAAAREIVLGLATGATAFDATLLVSAKSQVVFDLVSDEGTPSQAATMAVQRQLSGHRPDALHTALARVSSSTLADTLAAAASFLVPLFTAPLTTCAAISLDKSAKALAALGQSGLELAQITVVQALGLPEDTGDDEMDEADEDDDDEDEDEDDDA